MNLKKFAYLSSCLATASVLSSVGYAVDAPLTVAAQKSLEQRIHEMEESISQLKYKTKHSVPPAQRDSHERRLREMEDSIRQLKQEVATKRVETVALEAPKVAPDDLTIKVGGRVKLDAYYDVDAKAGTYGVFGGLMPLDGSLEANRKGHTNFALTGSQISVEAKRAFNGLPSRAYVEIDFSKDSSTTTSSYSPRIRHLYAELAGLLIGQTNFTFSNPEAYGRNLDNLYGQGRQAMVRYTHKFSRCLKLAVAVEKPISQYIDSSGNFLDNTTDGQSKLPDFATQLRYDYNTIGHIALSGVARRLAAKTVAGLNNALSSYSANGWGWGVGLSGKFKFYENNAIFGQANAGRGIGRYIDDLNNNNGQDFYLQVATVANPGLTNQFNILRTFNILGGFELWASDKINLNLGASLTKIQTPSGILSIPTYNRKLQRYFGNVIYKLLPNSDVGLQLMHYKRGAGTSVHQHGKDTRILASFIYKF